MGNRVPVYIPSPCDHIQGVFTHIYSIRKGDQTLPLEWTPNELNPGETLGATTHTMYTSLKSFRRRPLRNRPELAQNIDQYQVAGPRLAFLTTRTEGHGGSEGQGRVKSAHYTIFLRTAALVALSAKKRLDSALSEQDLTFGRCSRRTGEK